MEYPKCFDSQADFAYWQVFAQRAKEIASPCADCSKDYKTQMKLQYRCNERQVKQQFTNRKSKTIFLVEATA
jgi:hypothetical protein